MLPRARLFPQVGSPFPDGTPGVSAVVVLLRQTVWPGLLMFVCICGALEEVWFVLFTL